MARHDAIAVIDFGGQYAHLIATKVRRNRVLAEIHQPEDPVEAFAPYRGIILSGSPSLSSHGEDSAYTKEIFDLDIPILGFCFGHQEIAKHYGGQVIHGGREWGHADLRLTGDHPLFDGLGPVEQVWMSHFDTVSALGPDFVELGFTEAKGDEPVHHFAAIGSDRHRRYGFQFHPEVDDTAHGDEMIANFVLGICGCEPSWTMARYLESQTAAIRDHVGDRSVFLLASGGVDSTVAARLLGEALGPDRLHLLHIDNGLMRKEESRGVIEEFTAMGLDRNLHFVDASDTFLDALGDATEPEHKRAIIGNTFIAVFEEQAARLGIAGHLLGQGTIYPDTIETGGTKRADTIKTHHNRVPVIEEMIAAGKVVEPLAELYKVEVRELGEQLGIPRDAVWRHPFPGPGLGIRVLCSTGEAEDTSPLEDDVAAVAREHGLSSCVLPIRSVGVKADLRSYEHPVLFTGDAPWDDLMRASSRVLDELGGINRCLWNLGDAAPRILEIVPATMTRDRLDLLREADHLVMEGLRRHGLYDHIWQCATVLAPLRVDGHGRDFCIMRPVHSQRAMTARAARLPAQLVSELKQQILPMEGISGLALDLTSKPPGTIEWE